jgi:hypothetical protein
MGPLNLCEDLGVVAECDDSLGAGHVGNNNNTTCPIAGDNRFLNGGETDTHESFACIADVGLSGNGEERLMQAMVRAVGDHSDSGGCNEAFVREEAILVVTFITDEEDLFSLGTPTEWKQALVEAKGGNEDGVFVLGLFGDNDLDPHICEDMDEDGINGANPAPKLRELIESFGDKGHFCSVCEPDYTECFAAVVEPIDITCDEYEIE